MERNELALILIEQLNTFLYPKLEKTNFTKFRLQGSLTKSVVFGTVFSGKKTCIELPALLQVFKEYGIDSHLLLRVKDELSAFGDIVCSYSAQVMESGSSSYFVTVDFNLDLTKLNLRAFADEMARYE